jgi:hypothetical protein
MTKLRQLLLTCLLITFGSAPSAGLAAEVLSGQKTITLHARDGRATPIGVVNFRPGPGGSSFELQLDHTRLKDFFLSMKEFKCLDGGAEVLCHLPYPYANPRTVRSDDLAWLEHALLFFFKTPQDFGARLWNGIYFRLQVSERGLVGTPQAVDLDLIGVPPADLEVPPFGPGERHDIDPGRRWFERLTIE